MNHPTLSRTKGKPIVYVREADPTQLPEHLKSAPGGVCETLCMGISPCAFYGSFVEPFWV